MNSRLGMLFAAALLLLVHATSAASGASALAFSFTDGPFSLGWTVDLMNGGGGGLVTFELSRAGLGGWVAVGFPSSAARMGPGDVIVAWVAADGSPVVSDRFAPDAANTAPRVDALQSVRALSANGRMRVRFTRNLTTGDPADADLALGSRPFVWATASTAPSSALADAAVSIHSSRSSRELTVDFVTGRVVSTSIGESLRRAHGTLMVLAWVVLAPVGIATARFLRGVLGVWWFRVHVAVQVLAALLTLASFGLAVYTTGRHFSGANQAHKISGLVVTGVTALQSALGVLADRLWRADRPRTPVFPDYAHWALGYGVTGLAIVNCFTGLVANGATRAHFALTGAALGAIALVFAGLAVRFGCQSGAHAVASASDNLKSSEPSAVDASEPTQASDASDEVSASASSRAS